MSKERLVTLSVVIPEDKMGLVLETLKGVYLRFSMSSVDDTSPTKRTRVRSLIPVKSNGVDRITSMINHLKTLPVGYKITSHEWVQMCVNVGFVSASAPSTGSQLVKAKMLSRLPGRNGGYVVEGVHADTNDT